MKKFGIIATLCALLIGGFLVIDKNPKNPPLTNKQIEEQKEAEKQSELDKKLENVTVDPLIDMPVEKSGALNNSGESQAELMNREEILMLSFSNARQCNRLVYFKEKCKNKFVFALAVKNNDLNFCDTIKDDVGKQNCKDEIYYNTKVCTSIANSTLKQKCDYNATEAMNLIKKEELLKKASTSTDGSLCKELAYYNEKEACLRPMILKTKNIKLCDILNDPSEQSRCVKNITYELNRFIIDEAYTKKDLTICDQLQDVTIRKQCKAITF